MLINELTIHILAALARRPLTPSEISGQVASDSQSLILLLDSTLYKALAKLSAAGLIAKHGLHRYQLTPSGRALLKTETRRLYHLVSILQHRAPQAAYPPEP
jgi:DNA-binding PadR family transcriptional regulator